MPYMYALECADKSFNVGSTWNLDGRLWEHNASEGADYTKRRLPVRLVYYEDYWRIQNAYWREKQVQGWSRAKRIALIEGRFGDLPALCRKVDRRKTFGSDLDTPPSAAPRPAARD